MSSKALVRGKLYDLVQKEVGLSRTDSERLVERTLNLIAEALEAGEPVLLSGFGRFAVRDKRARTGRNPKTGEPASINSRRTISFRASTLMKGRVDRGLTR